MPRLPILTLLFAVAFAASGCKRDDASGDSSAYLLVHEPDQPTQGDQLLLEAVRRLGQRRTIQATFRLQANMLGESVTGMANYLEIDPVGEQRRLRFEVNFSFDKSTTNLIHVCDGKTFWFYTHVGKENNPRHIDLQRLDAAIRNTSYRQGQTVATFWQETGGLVKLLHRLQSTFWFSSATQGQLMGQVPVWRLEGHWRSNWLAQIMPEQKKAVEAQQPVDGRKLPSHTPDRVVLYLGQDDMFPYRVEFLRVSPTPREKGLPMPETHEPMILAVQCARVIFDAPLDLSYFQYQPGTQKSTDITNNFIQAYGLTEK